MDHTWTQLKAGQNLHGVLALPKRKLCDERGAIFHMLRCDDPEFTRFGEIYFSKVYAGVVKGWHIHREMTLNYLVVVGAVKLVLFDDRQDSPTRFCFQEVVLDETSSQLVMVPPLVWNGFKGLGNTPAIVANCASHPHHPEEISRRPYNDPYFAYDWSQRHG